MVAELFVEIKIRNILQANNHKRQMIPDSISVRFYKYGIQNTMTDELRNY